MQPQFSQVYLLHFDEPIGNRENPRAMAQHYIGYADHLGRRIAEHLTGRGAKITQELHRRGIGFDIARTWSGDRSFERRLKNRKNARALCPICAAARAQAQSQLDDMMIDDLI